GKTKAIVENLTENQVLDTALVLLDNENIDKVEAKSTQDDEVTLTFTKKEGKVEVAELVDNKGALRVVIDGNKLSIHSSGEVSKLSVALSTALLALAKNAAEVKVELAEGFQVTLRKEGSTIVIDAGNVKDLVTLINLASLVVEELSQLDNFGKGQRGVERIIVNGCELNVTAVFSPEKGKESFYIFVNSKSKNQMINSDNSKNIISSNNGEVYYTSLASISGIQPPDSLWWVFVNKDIIKTLWCKEPPTGIPKQAYVLMPVVLPISGSKDSSQAPFILSKSKESLGDIQSKVIDLPAQVTEFNIERLINNIQEQNYLIWIARGPPSIESLDKSVFFTPYLINHLTKNSSFNKYNWILPFIKLSSSFIPAIYSVAGGNSFLPQEGIPSLLSLLFYNIDYNCAVLSLSRLLPAIPLKQLKEDLAPYTDERGYTSLYGIQVIAAKYGLNLNTVKLTYDELINLNSPFIAHLKIEDGHYVVVEEIDENQVSLWDNGIKKTVSREEFESVWSGYILTSQQNIEAQALTAEETKEIKGGFWGSIGRAISNAVSSIGRAASRAVSSAKRAVSRAVSSVSRAVSNAASAAKSAISRAVSSVSRAFSGRSSHRSSSSSSYSHRSYSRSRSYSGSFSHHRSHSVYSSYRRHSTYSSHRTSVKSSNSVISSSNSKGSSNIGNWLKSKIAKPVLNFFTNIPKVINDTVKSFVVIPQDKNLVIPQLNSLKGPNPTKAGEIVGVLTNDIPHAIYDTVCNFGKGSILGLPLGFVGFFIAGIANTLYPHSIERAASFIASSLWGKKEENSSHNITPNPTTTGAEKDISKYWNFVEKEGKIVAVPKGFEKVEAMVKEKKEEVEAKREELDKYFIVKDNKLFYRENINREEADKVYKEYLQATNEYNQLINQYYEKDSEGNWVYKVSPEAKEALENYFDTLDANNQAISKYFDTQKIKVDFGGGQVKEISYMHPRNTVGIIGVEEGKVYTAEKIKDNAYILKEGEKPIILFVVKEGVVVSYCQLPSPSYLPSGAHIEKEEDGIKIIRNSGDYFTRIVVREDGRLEIHNYKATGTIYGMYPHGMYPGTFTVPPDNINMIDDIDSLPGVVDIEFAPHPGYFSSGYYTPVGILEFNTEDRKGPDNIQFISTGFSEEKGWLGGVIEKIGEGWNHMIFALDTDPGLPSLTAINTDGGVIYSIRKKDSKASISEEDTKVRARYGVYDIPYVDDYFPIGKVLVEANPLLPVTPGKMMTLCSDLSPEEKLFHFLTPNPVDYYLRGEAWKNYAYGKNKAEGISLDEDKLYVLEKGTTLESLDKDTVNKLLEVREEGKYMYFPEAYTIGDAVCDGTLIVVTVATLGSGTPEAAAARAGIAGADIAAESVARAGARVALEELAETGAREAGRSVIKNVVLNIGAKGANTWRSLPAITRSYVVGTTTYPLADSAISLIEKGEPLSLKETINSARAGGVVGVITYGTLKGLGLGISKAYPEAAERVISGGRFNPKIAKLESNPSRLGIRTVEEGEMIKKSLPRWIAEKGKIWGNKAAENLIRGAKGGWWIKAPEGKWIRIENLQKGAISGADLIAPTFKKVAGFTAIGPAFTIAGTGVQWLWDLGVNLKNGRLELPEVKWTGKELGLNYIEGMLLDTASFAKMGVYLPSLLGAFQTPLEATAEGAVSRALFSSHRISNIFRTAYRGLIKRDSQAIAELAEENLIRDMGRRGLKEIWRREGAKALAKEIGKRGIGGIDNAFFVTGTIQVTGKISEEILKALGVSPATAKELGREAGFISLFFIPAPHPFGEAMDPTRILIKQALREENIFEATHKNPRVVFDSDKGWVVKATSLNPGREETIAEVIGVVPSEKSYSIILATDRIPLENRDNQNGGRISFQNRENEAVIADNSREITLQNGGRVENVNYQSERNGEKLDNSQRAPPQIVLVKKIDTDSFLQSSNLLPSDIDTNSIHIYEVNNNNGETPRYIASYDYKGEKVLLGVGYNRKGEVEIGVSKESLGREIGKFEIRSSYNTVEDLAEAIANSKFSQGREDIAKEVLVERIPDKELVDILFEGRVKIGETEVDGLREYARKELFERSISLRLSEEAIQKLKEKISEILENKLQGKDPEIVNSYKKAIERYSEKLILDMISTNFEDELYLQCFLDKIVVVTLKLSESEYKRIKEEFSKSKEKRITRKFKIGDEEYTFEVSREIIEFSFLNSLLEEPAQRILENFNGENIEMKVTSDGKVEIIVKKEEELSPQTSKFIEDFNKWKINLRKEDGEVVVKVNDKALTKVLSEILNSPQKSEDEAIKLFSLISKIGAEFLRQELKEEFNEEKMRKQIEMVANFLGNNNVQMAPSEGKTFAFAMEMVIRALLGAEIKDNEINPKFNMIYVVPQNDIEKTLEDGKFIRPFMRIFGLELIKGERDNVAILYEQLTTPQKVLVFGQNDYGHLRNNLHSAIQEAILFQDVVRFDEFHLPFADRSTYIRSTTEGENVPERYFRVSKIIRNVVGKLRDEGGIEETGDFEKVKRGEKVIYIDDRMLLPSKQAFNEIKTKVTEEVKKESIKVSEKEIDSLISAYFATERLKIGEDFGVMDNGELKPISPRGELEEQKVFSSPYYVSALYTKAREEGVSVDLSKAKYSESSSQATLAEILRYSPKTSVLGASGSLKPLEIFLLFNIGEGVKVVSHFEWERIETIEINKNTRIKEIVEKVRKAKEKGRGILIFVKDADIYREIKEKLNEEKIEFKEINSYTPEDKMDEIVEEAAPDRKVVLSNLRGAIAKDYSGGKIDLVVADAENWRFSDLIQAVTRNCRRRREEAERYVLYNKEKAVKFTSEADKKFDQKRIEKELENNGINIDGLNNADKEILVNSMRREIKEISEGLLHNLREVAFSRSVVEPLKMMIMFLSLSESSRKFLEEVLREAINEKDYRVVLLAESPKSAEAQIEDILKSIAYISKEAMDKIYKNKNLPDLIRFKAKEISEDASALLDNYKDIVRKNFLREGKESLANANTLKEIAQIANRKGFLERILPEEVKDELGVWEKAARVIKNSKSEISVKELGENIRGEIRNSGHSEEIAKVVTAEVFNLMRSAGLIKPKWYGYPVAFGACFGGGIKSLFNKNKEDEEKRGFKDEATISWYLTLFANAQLTEEGKKFLEVLKDEEGLDKALFTVYKELDDDYAILLYLAFDENNLELSKFLSLLDIINTFKKVDKDFWEKYDSENSLLEEYGSFENFLLKVIEDRLANKIGKYSYNNDNLKLFGRNINTKLLEDITAEDVAGDILTICIEELRNKEAIRFLYEFIQFAEYIEDLGVYKEINVEKDDQQIKLSSLFDAFVQLHKYDVEPQVALNIAKAFKFLKEKGLIDNDKSLSLAELPRRDFDVKDIQIKTLKIFASKINNENFKERLEGFISELEKIPEDKDEKISLYSEIEKIKQNKKFTKFQPSFKDFFKMLEEMNLENEKDSYILASLFYSQIDLTVFGYLYSFSRKDKGLIEIKPDTSLYKLITTENNNLLKYIKLTEEAKEAEKEAKEINLNSEEAKLSKEFLIFLLYAGLNADESKAIKILKNVGIEEGIIEQIKSKKDNYGELRKIVGGIEDEKTIEILEGFGVLEKEVLERVFKEIFGESLFKAAYGYYKKGNLSKEDVFIVIGLITRSKFRHNPDIFTLKEALKKKETGCVTNAQINYLGALILGIEPENIVPIRMTDGVNRPHIVLVIKSGEKGKIVDSTPLGGKINFVSKEFDLENDFEKVMDEKGRIYFQAKKDIGNPYLDLEHKRFRILPSLLAPVLVNQGEKEENIELLEMGLKIDSYSEIGWKKLLELKVEEKLKKEKEAFNKLQENCVIKAISELNGNTPEEITEKVLNYMDENEKEIICQKGLVPLSRVLSAIKELNHQEFTVYRKENGNGGEFYIVNNNPQKYVSITPNQRYHHAQVVEEPSLERVIEGAEMISQERWNELFSILVGFDGGKLIDNPYSFYLPLLSKESLSEINKRVESLEGLKKHLFAFLRDNLNLKRRNVKSIIVKGSFMWGRKDTLPGDVDVVVIVDNNLTEGVRSFRKLDLSEYNKGIFKGERRTVEMDLKIYSLNYLRNKVKENDEEIILRISGFVHTGVVIEGESIEEILKEIEFVPSFDTTISYIERIKNRVKGEYNSKNFAKAAKRANEAWLGVNYLLTRYLKGLTQNQIPWNFEKMAEEFNRYILGEMEYETLETLPKKIEKQLNLLEKTTKELETQKGRIKESDGGKRRDYIPQEKINILVSVIIISRTKVIFITIVKSASHRSLLRRAPPASSVYLSSLPSSLQYLDYNTDLGLLMHFDKGEITPLEEKAVDNFIKEYNTKPSDVNSIYKAARIIQNWKYSETYGRPITETFKKKEGDCLDKSVALSLVAQRLGFESGAVVFTPKDGGEGHAICWVDLNKDGEFSEKEIVDLTTSYPFGTLSITNHYLPYYAYYDGGCKIQLAGTGKKGELEIIYPTTSFASQFDGGIKRIRDKFDGGKPEYSEYIGKYRKIAKDKGIDSLIGVCDLNDSREVTSQE
ncbi:MAG: hypothetical protein J7K17_04580, partial [Candidatus Omnitrophica bacterium]|nr:hypothetical protein [Candidatus Omnitrophota bacterium]